MSTPTKTSPVGAAQMVAGQGVHFASENLVVSSLGKAPWAPSCVANKATPRAANGFMDKVGFIILWEQVECRRPGKSYFFLLELPDGACQSKGTDPWTWKIPIPPLHWWRLLPLRLWRGLFRSLFFYKHFVGEGGTDLNAVLFL